MYALRMAKVEKRRGQNRKKVVKRRRKNIVRSATSHALGVSRGRQTPGPRIPRIKSRTTMARIYDGRSQEKKKNFEGYELKCLIRRDKH